MTGTPPSQPDKERTMTVIDGDVPDRDAPTDEPPAPADPAHSASLVLRGATTSEVTLRTAHDLAADLSATAQWIADALDDIPPDELHGDGLEEFVDTQAGELMAEVAALAEWQAECLRAAFTSTPEALAARSHVVSARVWSIVDSW